MTLAILACLLAFAPQQSNNTELQTLRDADQAARQNLATINWDQVSKDDADRRKRVAEMLAGGLIQTGVDYENASLIFQHGDTSHDYLVANEFAVVAAALGRTGSLSAVSQDRFLESIGKTQRFGTQYDLKGAQWTAKPTDETGPTAVTDELRLDLLIPSLNLEKTKGPGAFEAAKSALTDRMSRNVNPSWEIDENKSAVAQELEQEADNPNEDSRARVLALYKDNKLQSDQELRDAAVILRSSGDANELILATDLSMAAAEHADVDALATYAKSFDRYLAAIGMPPMFGTTGSAPDPMAARPILQSLATP